MSVKTMVVTDGRREHMSDIVRAVAALLSHQQTAELPPGTNDVKRQAPPGPATPHRLPCTSS
nr:hypothetical protein StreXyl84_77200 [Streptomyces sp. Xyl84]